MTLQEFVFFGTKAQALPYKCRRIDKRGVGKGDKGREIECRGYSDREWTDDKVRTGE